MDKMIVCVFDTEAKAYEGLKALKELSEEGSVYLYASAVVNKDEQGHISVKQSSDEGPIGFTVATLCGALIGIVGGPMGMAAGATAGAMLGSLADIETTGVGINFANDVANQLSQGKTAVIAEVAEDWDAPLSSRMEELGGKVIRQNRSSVVDEQFNREIEDAAAELDEVEQELQRVNEEVKSTVQGKVSAAKKKLEDAKYRAHTRAESLQAEAIAKYELLKEEANKAKSELKGRYKNWASDVRENYEQSTAKIKEACSTS